VRRRSAALARGAGCHDSTEIESKTKTLKTTFYQLHISL
jgi:hypothetical protein